MSTQTTAKVPQKNEYQKAIYSRSKDEIHRPQTKLTRGWTNSYTAKFQSFWNQSYGYSNMTNKRKSEIIPRKRKNPKLPIKRSVTANTKATNDIAAKLLTEMCHSLQFGLFNLANLKDESKGLESNIVSFWFGISFEIYKEKYFLYFNYLKDETIKWNPHESDEIVHSNKIQITCDLEYVQTNKIINSENLALPTDVLIEVFKFVKPTKMLALYGYDVDVDTRSLDKRNFNFSNMDWICNYFGLSTHVLRKMLRMVIRFSYFEQVQKYIENEKTYDQNWKEWQDAQQELNMIYVNNYMKEKGSTRKNLMRSL